MAQELRAPAAPAEHVHGSSHHLQLGFQGSDALFRPLLAMYAHGTYTHTQANAHT